MIWRPNESWSSRLTEEHRWPIASEHGDYDVWRLEARYLLAPGFDLRVHREQSTGFHSGTVTRVGIGAYW